MFFLIFNFQSAVNVRLIVSYLGTVVGWTMVKYMICIAVIGL